MPTTEPFGAMLRRLRISAGLTQERLAERSGISATGVAALEAGRRKSPRLNTVGLLCDALALSTDQRAILLAAATQANASPPEHLDQRVTESATSDAARSRTNTTTFERSAPSSFLATPTVGFVGRRKEREILHNAWTNKTRLVLLFGEAGVGKTTLAHAFAAELSEHDIAILHGRSTAEQLGVYEAFVEPVRTALGRFDGNIPTGFRDLGKLVPGLFGLGGVPATTGSDPAVERRLFFETVRSLLRMAGPTLIVLDDLQWADPGTLSMLSFLVAQPELAEVMFVGTIRSTDLAPTTSAALGELRRHCVLERIQLGGLTRHELTDLMTTVAGSAVSPALINAVTTATNGNPLYIKELTEHLLQRGFDTTSESGAHQEHAPTTPEAVHTVPDSIRHTIELRVSSLSKDAQSLLRGGAALGQSFDLFVAGQLASLSGESLLVAIEDALLSGLLVEQAGTSATFSHGLVATTVYESTSRLRRLALHRLAAETLANHGPVSSSEIVNVARHWAIVAEADPTARNTAAQWSLRAGNAAASSAAVDEAIACYERAATYWNSDAAELPDTLVQLGSALVSIGKLSEGNEQLQRGLRLADERHEHEVYARAALSLAATVRYTMSDATRIAELERAIEKLGPSEMVLRPALLATLRRQLGFVETEAASQRRNEAATLVAEAVLAPDVSDELIMTLGGLRDSLVVDDPIPLGHLARKIITVASARRDLPAMSTGWYRQAWSALELGEVEVFRTAVAEYRRIAEQLRRPYELAMSSNMIAAVAQIEGRYADAEAAGQEALAHAATIEDGNFSWVYFANSGLRAVDQGLVKDTLDLLKAGRADFAGLRTFEAALVAISAAAGERDLAKQLLDEQVGPHGETLDGDWVYLSAERLPVVGLLAWGCAFADEARYSQIVLDRLLRIASTGVRVVRIAPVGAWIGPIDHHIGALSRIVGDVDRAQRHLEQALLVEDEINGRPFQVRTQLELAAVAAARGGSRGAKDAAYWRSEAETLATKLGLEALLS